MKPAQQPTAAAVPNSRLKSIRDQFKMVSGPVYIAVMLFAMSTWIAVVGIWVEMPLLVNALPESWNLPSYLVIIIQCANLGPATYAIWDKMRRRNQQVSNEQQQHQQHSHVDSEVVVSLIIILTAIVSMLLLSLFWDRTEVIASVNRSVALLTLVCFSSLSCCTSSVVFLPYMARFPSVYISAYYFGQGLCGLVPGLLGLAQVAGQEPHCRNETDVNDTMAVNMYGMTAANYVHYSSPRFSISAFFVLITLLLCVSAAAFCSLNFVQKCHSEMTTVVVAATHDQNLENVAEVMATREAAGLLERRENPDSDTAQSDNNVVENVAVIRQQRRFISLFVTIGIISALWNGVLPATQTYTCLPYGNIVYRLAVCLSWVVSPLATLPNMLAPTSSLSLITGLGTVASTIAALHLYLASQSPYPILQGSVVGQIIVVSLVLSSSY